VDFACPNFGYRAQFTYKISKTCRKYERFVLKDTAMHKQFNCCGLVVSSLLAELWIGRSNPARVKGGSFYFKSNLIAFLSNIKFAVT
jgi:hypothetical protein